MHLHEFNLIDRFGWRLGIFPHLWCTSGIGVGPAFVFIVFAPFRFDFSEAYPYPFYADDIQLYLTLKHGENYDMHFLLDCLSEVRCWLADN